MPKRFINSEIWETDNFLDLSTEQKLLTFFMITRCDNIGVFKVSLKMASFQLGFKVEEKDILNLDLEISKIQNWYWLEKFCMHQYGELKESCPPHRSYIQSLKNLGLYERVFKGYSKGIYTLQEKEKEKEKEKDSVEIKKIVDFLNSQLGSNYKHSTAKTKTLISARLNEGFTLKDFNDVICKKVNMWKGTDFEKYLRPETLFGTKFESYLQEKDNSINVLSGLENYVPSKGATSV